MANRRRWLKPLLIVAALIVATVLIMPLVPLDFLKPAVQSRLSAALGRKVEVSSLRLSLWGGPYLTIGGMTAKEDPAFGGGDFFKADQVRADFAVLRYIFNQEVSIDGLTITSPDFTLIKNRDGVWSWTTLGGATTEASPQAAAEDFGDSRLAFIEPAAFFQNKLSSSALKSVVIENASVRLVDQTAGPPSETVYKNIALNANVAPAEGSTSPAASRATGELRADSGETNGGEILKTTLPFDLNISRSERGGLVVEGTVGPGPFETTNFIARSFTLATKLATEPAQQAGGQQASSVLRGQGHISASEVVLPRINVSEQVAREVQLSGLGDMNAGTTINNLETDFHIDPEAYRTTGLRIQQLDGLGDAHADQGWFKIASALTLNYAATITLSEQATAQVKSSSPLAGLVSLIQNSSRLSVSFNIIGDVRNPQVRVDVLKTLGL
jgi:AsmA family